MSCIPNCRAFFVGIDTGFLQSFVVSLSVERSEFMPKNRIIPFGYCMKNGEIITEPKELYAVVTVFNEYLKGKSLSEIAALMEVPYSENSSWNKNMVKRIIENDRYLGTEKFPQIIDKETFKLANEKHEEAPNIDTDIYWLKKKMEAGAEYAVTQLFYDNRKYFDFVERARKAGVTIPIIPGIKPFKKISQISMIPKTFKVDLPEELACEAMKCKTDEEAKQVGIEWCVKQCKELVEHGVPSIHFYSIGAVDSIKEVAKLVY